MDLARERISDVTPKLRARDCGGWLAVSPKWARFLVGVTADTKEEAIEKFRSEFAKWVATVDGTIHENT